jgi:hypothetical protein
MEYPVGTKFMSFGKYPKECTVIDVLKTYNSKNELVDVSYNATHNFLGQEITHKYLPAASIARGVFALEKKLEKV